MFVVHVDVYIVYTDIFNRNVFSNVPTGYQEKMKMIDKTFYQQAKPEMQFMPDHCALTSEVD